jgi:hypothetical protein
MILTLILIKEIKQMKFTQQLINMVNSLRKHNLEVVIEGNTAFIKNTPFAFETGSTITIYKDFEVIERLKQPKIALKYLKEVAA